MNSFSNITKHTYFTTIALLVILVLAILLRLSNITTEEFWYDEVLSLIIAYYAVDTHEILSYVREVYHTPLYYYFARFWTHSFGLSELSGRMFALLFSVGGIAGVYLLGKKLFSKHVALIAAFFMAISPLQVEFGQEARPYSLIMFLGIFSMYFFWQFINTPNKNSPLLYIFIINVIGIYTHYDYFILVAAQIGIIVALRLSPYFQEEIKTIFKKGILWWGLLGITFIPWIVYTIIPSASGIQYALNKSAVTVFSIFLDGELWFNVVGTAERFQAFLAFLGQLIVIGIIVFIIQRAFILFKENKIFKGELLSLLFVISWYLFSLGFYFYSPLSSQYTPNWQRHIIIFGAPFYLMLAYGLSRIPIRRYAYVFSAIIISSMILPLYYVMKNDSTWAQHHNNKIMFEYIEEHEQEGDLVFVPGRLWEVVALYYFKGDSQVGGFLPLKGFNSIAARKTYYLPAVEEVRYAYKRPQGDLYVGISELPALVEPYGRVWLFHPSDETHIFNWFIENWNYVECPEGICSRMYLFENPHK